MKPISYEGRRWRWPSLPNPRFGVLGAPDSWVKAQVFTNICPNALGASGFRRTELQKRPEKGHVPFDRFGSHAFPGGKKRQQPGLVAPRCPKAQRCAKQNGAFSCGISSGHLRRIHTNDRATNRGRRCAKCVAQAWNCGVRELFCLCPSASSNLPLKTPIPGEVFIFYRHIAHVTQKVDILFLKR